MAWIPCVKVDPPPPPPIYGVEWDGTSTTAWSRTDDALLFGDPNAYYSGMSGSPSSPFDNILPWSGMKIVEDTDAGTLVEIPKFYYKIPQSTTGLKIRISTYQYEGFQCSPAHMDRGDGQGERDVIYVGRYHCGATEYKSASGQKPKANITRTTARATIPLLGSDIWQWDFATRFTIWLLYLVEFADWNSQAKIGYGCGNNSSTNNMGYTDSMPYHTGTTQTSRTTYGGTGGTQYRYIEGLWDNVFDWLDGCYYKASGLSIILNPANFSDSSGGTIVGKPSAGFPTKFTVKDVTNTFKMFIPTTASGSNSTYSCDYWNFDESNPYIYVGGSYSQSLSSGLFCVYYTSASGYSASRGCRLMKLPNKS